MHVAQRRPVLVGAVILALATAAAGCGGSSSSSGSSGGSSSNANIPPVDASNLGADFATLKALSGLAAEGKGMVGVLLPDTTTSTRYEQYDAPYLKQAFEAAGLSSSDFKVDNAQGKATTMQAQAEADITEGASVLLVDALDPSQHAELERVLIQPRNYQATK